MRRAQLQINGTFRGGSGAVHADVGRSGGDAELRIRGYSGDGLPRQILLYGIACKASSKRGGTTWKKRVLTETFGCSGYDVTPKELKSVAEMQYFGGVNVMCQHLYPYSVAGRGRIDHPPVFGPHGNWNEGFKAFNDYFARLSYIVANTEEKAKIGVIHPMRDIWLDYVRSEDYESVKRTEEDFNEFCVY